MHSKTSLHTLYLFEAKVATSLELKGKTDLLRKTKKRIQRRKYKERDNTKKEIIQRKRIQRRIAQSNKKSDDSNERI